MEHTRIFIFLNFNFVLLVTSIPISALSKIVNNLHVQSFHLFIIVIVFLLENIMSIKICKKINNEY